MVKTYAEIIGIEQVHEVLNGLPKRLNRKLLNQATRKAAKPILQAAKSNVSSHSKIVAKQVKVWVLKRSYRAGVWVGWRMPKGSDIKSLPTRAAKAWAAMGAFWLEYGTSGQRRRGGAARRIPATGWFRRAVDTNINKVERDFTKDLQYVINRFLDKAITRHGW